MTAKKVLVVEDEAITALDVIETVRQIGYDVTEHVMSGEEAVTSASRNSPDLVLMDIKLKGTMDGITAAEKIWDQLKIPIVFLTAFADEGTLGRAKLVKPYGYVLKPFEEHDLRAAIDIALYRWEQEQPKRRLQHAADVNFSGVIPIGSSQCSPFEFLKRVDPFRQLSEEALLTFSESTQVRELIDGEFIVHQGATTFPSFVVASGRIALSKISSNGKELVVNLLPPGDLFGVVMALETEPSNYSAQAQGDALILELDRETLNHLLNDHPQLYRELTEYLRVKVEQSHNFAQRLAHERADVRIAASLQALLCDFARLDRVEGSYRIEITRMQLAELTGTTPETAIRITKKMERDGLLDLTEPGIILVIDADGIEALLGE